MPLLNSNKLYQFHKEARPTNSYAYFFETFRTCTFFHQESYQSAILYISAGDTRVVLRSCPYLCRGTDIPQQLTYGFCYLLREELSIRNISLFDSGHQYLIIRLNASIFTLETEGIAALGYIVVDLCGIIMGKATHYLIIIQQWQ